MKKIQKTIAKLVLIAMCMSLIATSLIACGGGGDDKKDYSHLTKLTIDAGGQNAQYNSTLSLDYDKYLNPYPYNTLETLVDKWNERNVVVVCGCAGVDNILHDVRRTLRMTTC